MKIRTILAALALSFTVGSVRASDVDFTWGDATIEVVPAVLSSIKSGEAAAGAAILGLMAAFNGEDFYAVKIEVKNQSWHSLSLYASDFEVDAGNGKSSKLVTFLQNGGHSTTYATTIGLGVGESRAVYGIYVAGPTLGNTIRRGGGYLRHPLLK